MKIVNSRICLFFVTLLFFLTTTNAQQIWTKKGEVRFILNSENLNNKLKDISPQNPKITLLFPNVEGELIPFEIYDNAVLPQSLAAKYPQVHSYKGIARDNKQLQIRFTCTPSGIEGTIISEGKTLNLTSPRSNNIYTLQEKKYPRGRKGFECKTKKNEKQQSKKSTNRSSKSIRGINQLRTIRLAVTTSGEYSNFFIRKNNLESGSEAQQRGAVLAGIATSINAINVAFERDLGVRFELIPNTDVLFFLNRNTDPFTDPNNADLIIDQGAAVIKNRIASADYDLGHTLVGAGNAGLATLQSVCSNVKAEAMTGFREPEGFFFDFTLFAHELGHQLGGLHTQSANCQQETPIEVGSGTTIMGYSGACGVDNIQPQSDSFFHSLSIEQIFVIIQNLEFVSNCGVQVSSIDNSLPVIPSISNYTVPLGLPLYLETPATDADADPLTYSWEPFEEDEGFIFPSPPEENSGSGPQFRVFPPTNNPRRNFPRSGINSMWEVLPTVPRTMDFKLFVRDGKPGGIAISDIVEIKTVDQGTQFRITSPIEEEVSYGQNETLNITWDVAGTNLAPFNVTNVKIEFSYDNGVTYPVVLAENELNDGEAIVKTPIGTTTNQGKIRISAKESAFYVFSDNSIEISDVLQEGVPTVDIASEQDLESNLLIFSVESSFSAPQDIVFFPTFTNADNGESIDNLGEVMFSVDNGATFNTYDGNDLVLRTGTSQVLIALPLRENIEGPNALRRVRLEIGVRSGDVSTNITASESGFIFGRNLSLEDNIVIAPNPSRAEEVTILAESFNGEGYDIKVYSLIGELIIDTLMVDREQTFNFSVLSAGLYLIRITSSDEVATKKLIVE